MQPQMVGVISSREMPEALYQAAGVIGRAPVARLAVVITGGLTGAEEILRVHTPQEAVTRAFELLAAQGSPTS